MRVMIAKVGVRIRVGLGLENEISEQTGRRKIGMG